MQNGAGLLQQGFPSPFAETAATPLLGLEEASHLMLKFNFWAVGVQGAGLAAISHMKKKKKVRGTTWGKGGIASVLHQHEVSLLMETRLPQACTTCSLLRGRSLQRDIFFFLENGL